MPIPSPRVDRIREFQMSKQEVVTPWIITSLTVDQANASRSLESVGLYWCIASNSSEGVAGLPLDELTW